MALQEAGCFCVVLECVPAPVAAAVTSALQIPTIGIGAGRFCSGQVRRMGLLFVSYTSHNVVHILEYAFFHLENSEA